MGDWTFPRALGPVLLAVVAVGAGTVGAGAQSAAPAADDALSRLNAAGTIRVNTDPNYAPQSFQNADGTFAGFDIDVANAIASRLGLKIEWTTFGFDAVVAGGWADRWDMSVGSVTITEERKKALDFTQPYYYTPAQFAATIESGITSLDGFVNQPICVGAATTYQYWLESALTLVDAPPPAAVPSGAIPYVLGTDQDCAQSVQSGRSDFQGWLSSSTTVANAIAAGTPMVTVGDPVFYEALAVAFDNTVPDQASLIAAVDEVIAGLHADGTLTKLSQQWFDGLDLSTVSQ
jgi:polar amino acid transport system substrate-binding protein